MGSVNHMFLLCAMHDFIRRRESSQLLSNLVINPGVQIDTFVNNDFHKETDVPIKSDTLAKKKQFDFVKTAVDEKLSQSSSLHEHTISENKECQMDFELTSKRHSIADTFDEVNKEIDMSVLAKEFPSSKFSQHVAKKVGRGFSSKERKEREAKGERDLKSCEKITHSHPLEGFCDHVYFNIREPDNAYAWSVN